MPNYTPPPDQWLAGQLAQMKQDLAALKTQSTQYIIDPKGVCQAIIGDLSHDPKGKLTGLAPAWGMAVLREGVWVNVEKL